jgi:hypothetical protein
LRRTCSRNPRLAHWAHAPSATLVTRLSAVALQHYPESRVIEIADRLHADRRALRLDTANEAGHVCHGQLSAGTVSQRLDHNYSRVIRCYGPHSQLALLLGPVILTRSAIPIVYASLSHGKGGNIPSSRLGFEPAGGIQSFHLTGS